MTTGLLSNSCHFFPVGNTICQILWKAWWLQETQVFLSPPISHFPTVASRFSSSLQPFAACHPHPLPSCLSSCSIKQRQKASKGKKEKFSAALPGCMNLKKKITKRGVRDKISLLFSLLWYSYHERICNTLPCIFSLWFPPSWCRMCPLGPLFLGTCIKYLNWQTLKL